MGFRVDVASNSRHAIEAAEESWGGEEKTFENPAVQLNVIVQPTGGLAPEPVFRARRQMFMIVADRDNFACYESGSMSGSCFVSEKTVADHPWFRFHFLETMAYMLLAQRWVMALHAACVVHDGRGFLLCGHSGAGKSTLAWTCARNGWTYVTDDGAWLPVESGAPLALGRSRFIRFRDDAPGLFPELAGYRVGARPNGKLTIEIPLAGFPKVKTASSCRLGAMVLLDRRPDAEPAASPLASSEITDRLLRDMPWYGEAVRALYQKGVQPLLQVPAYRLSYQETNQAFSLLSTL